MSEALTPQEALDIASNTTQRAQAAPATHWWAPPVGGLLAGLTVPLIVTAIPDIPANLLLLVAGTVTGAAYFILVGRVMQTWRSGGVMPRAYFQEPVQPWKQLVAFELPPLLLGGLCASLNGWMSILGGVLIAGWVWYQLARKRARACPN
ncbi:hypothetical protein AB0N05_32740 [Nocardia sp. NPDC051030]|uniref:hypothetical protein n=1 Tax=Nocardia sp. NPDC051030 TaxID=3155162 RepID=UPI00341E29AA